MRLIELRANKESFHTITFKPKGISLIVATQKTDDKGKTYNSVGKTLTIAIIHFCLGANDNKGFKEKLNDWEFTLEFQVYGTSYTCRRNTDKQREIFLNDKKYSVDKFREELGKKIFVLDRKIKNLTFRTLISRFIRPKKGSYVSYETYVPKEPDYRQLLNNAFLLGLDLNPIVKKQELKAEFDNVKKLKDAFNKDANLKTFFQGNNDDDIDLKIVNLQENIETLNKNLKEFKIADDYNKIREEADKISYQIKDYKNEAFKYENAIRNIEKSLNIKPDISKSDIEKLYNEANITLSDIIVKKLEELEEFNKKLLDNRIRGLNQEKSKFQAKLVEINKKIQLLGIQENDKLKYLDTHGALEEFVQLNNSLSDKLNKLNKLKNYKDLQRGYKQKFDELTKEFIEENISATKYLERAQDIKERNIKIFKDFVDTFYNRHKYSGISIENNERQNGLRFNIIAKIDDDSGDAVSKVKIFCFDWTLLKGQNNHNVKFLFHDSVITDGMDTRQVEAMFRIANKECEKGDFQYIISANHNTLENLQVQLGTEDYDKLIKSNVVLELSDKSHKDKLLGIQVDLKYES